MTDIAPASSQQQLITGAPELAELRRQYVMQKILEGTTLTHQIHEAWNQDHPSQQVAMATIVKDRRHALDALAAQTTITAMQVRDIIGAQLNAVIRALLPRVQKGELSAIDRYLKTLSQLAELYGANMPAKIAMTDVTGTKDVGTMSEEERTARLMEMMERAKQRAAEGEDD